MSKHALSLLILILLIVGIVKLPSSAKLVFNSNPEPKTIKTQMLGLKLYQEYCLACHGPKGLGDGINSQSMKTKPTNLVEFSDRPEWLIAYLISEGTGEMPAWKDVLSEQQIWQLSYYIKQLNKNSAH
jgi:mono/diheme cytochrome c family protein